jgi:hypothetical protein
MNGLILRTCDNISNKCWFTDKGLSLKSYFLNNTLNYALSNNYKIFIVCDSVSREYQALIESIFGNYATLFFYENLGAYGSFEKQLEIGLESNLDFIEIAEDDFLKKGLIDFDSLDKSTVYTGYHHPNHDKLPWSAFEKVTGNLYSTVCSFVFHRQVLINFQNDFYRFRISSDSEMWYEMTAPVWLKILLKIKAFSQFRTSKISLFKNGNLRLRRLDTNVTWVHCAKDSLPSLYSDLSQYSKIDDAIKHYQF